MSYLMIKENQQYWVVKLTCKKSTIVKLLVSVAAVIAVTILRMLFR